MGKLRHLGVRWQQSGDIAFEGPNNAGRPLSTAAEASGAERTWMPKGKPKAVSPLRFPAHSKALRAFSIWNPGLFLFVTRGTMRCFYSQDLELELPAGHPFPMEKFRVSKDMLLDGGILRPEEIIEVKAADIHLLRRVHEADYISRIESGTLDRKEQILLGLPASPRLYHRSATEVEATRLACHAALAEGVGVCLAGGTHHAFREHGEGYCVFNDIAIAIRDLQDKQPNIKIMVVDTDAHQGNGTAALLAGDPRVFTYSIHVGKNYPTRKSTGTLDVETVRYVEGEMYLKQLFTSLAGALDAFAPDLVIWISGADNHRNDRFGQMHLSLKDIQRRDEVLLGAFIKNRIPVAVLYGGGYNRQPEFTAKLHRNTIATAKRLASEFRGL